jgi:4-hydroxy-2-oxoglutarate aldolase
VRPAGLHGVMAPLPTPFDAVSGDPAPVALRQVVRSLLASGLHGVVTAGSTGEGELLDDSERTRLVEWLRDVVPEDRWLIAGAGAESTRGAIRLAQAAAEAGADAVLVRPPSYFGGIIPAVALAAHYQRLADESPVPVIVYNIPKYAHVAIQDVTLRVLAEHERIVGFKDSSGDLKVFSAFRAAAPAVAALMGSGQHIYAALEMGGAGGILAVSCFAPGPCAELYRAFRGEDRQSAGSLQERLEVLAREIVGAFGPAGIKAAMDAVGLPCGPVREPLVNLDARQRARVAELVAASGLAALGERT